MPRTRPVRGILFFGGCDVLTPACAQWADWSGYRGEQGGNACTALLPLVRACCATPSAAAFRLPLCRNGYRVAQGDSAVGEHAGVDAEIHVPKGAL